MFDDESFDSEAFSISAFDFGVAHISPSYDDEAFDTGGFDVLAWDLEDAIPPFIPGVRYVRTTRKGRSF